MKRLYDALEPYAVHRIDVGHTHHLYVEECGNPQGLPVIFLHGGPGSGCRAHHRCFFDPNRYRIVLLDQRGAGRSTPHGHLIANTTEHLLQDLEQIRVQLNIERWLVFGGSWGATLALLYAQRHPERCFGLVLRGSFLARRKDLTWFLGHGAERTYPEAWQQFLEALPPTARRQPVAYLYRQVTGRDELAQRRAARIWSRWGGQVTLAAAFDSAALDAHVPHELVNKARIELHYARHRYFMRENQILEDCPRIAHLPILIAHGREDRVCPPEAAYALHRALPGSSLNIIDGVGHLAEGDVMIHTLVDATDRLAARLYA